MSGPSAASRTKPRATRAEMEARYQSIVEVAEREHPLTVRQLFYRLVAAGAVPKTQLAYDRIQRATVTLRESGRLPWYWLVDNMRSVLGAHRYAGPADAARHWSEAYRKDIAAKQPCAVQLWAESDSVAGIIAPTANWYGVDTYVGRGFSSVTYLWSASAFIVDALHDGRAPVVLHVGDYDPSGDDIYRDVVSKMCRYAAAQRYHLAADDVDGEDVEVELSTIFERVAVTAEQVREYDLPTQPVKTTDSRAATWEGTGTVEAEAFTTPQLRAIVQEAIEGWFDMEALRVAQVAEDSERAVLASIAASMREAP